MTLLDIDDLAVSGKRDEKAIERANKITRKYIAEFYEWCSKRDIAKDTRIVGQVLSDVCKNKLEGRLCENRTLAFCVIMTIL